jgi:hypothetical protein
VQVESRAENLATPKQIAERISLTRSASTRQLEKASLVELCRLARRNDIRLDVVWPPAPKAVAQAFVTQHIYQRIQSDISSAFEAGGCATEYANINSVRDYDDFLLDAMHVRGEGWEERVAGDYRDYLSRLPARNSPPSDAVARIR